MLSSNPRPPVLRAIGIAGIVIAALSVIASLITAGYGAGLYLNTHAARDRFLRNAPAALPVSRSSDAALLTTPLATPLGRHGIEAGQRPAVIEAVSKKIEMSPEQARQLDALLAADGSEIFGVPDGETVSGDRVLEAIGRFGLLPAIGADAAEPFYFETSAGRTEVFATRALFYRKSSLSPIRVTAGRRINSSGHPVLTPPDVDAIVGLVQQARGGTSGKGAKLNDAQLRTLRSLLEEPAQQVIAVNASPEGEMIGIQGAHLSSDDYAVVDFTGGSLLLSPSGKVVLKSDRDAVPAVNGAAAALVVIESVLSIALAVFLLIASIGLLRRPRQKMRPMMIYATSKIPLAFFAAGAFGWLTFSFMTSKIHGVHPHPDATVASLLAGGAVLIAGVSFPVALLIVSRRKSVREFYES